MRVVGGKKATMGADGRPCLVGIFRGFEKLGFLRKGFRLGGAHGGQRMGRVGIHSGRSFEMWAGRDIGLSDGVGLGEVVI